HTRSKRDWSSDCALPIFIGNGVFGFSRDTVRVIRRDLYEPNETSPTRIDLETARPFPGTILNVLLFLNPALSFEPLLRDVKQGRSEERRVGKEGKCRWAG